jgi:5-methylcytosine-specific restriction endonuclease McrA
MPLYVVYAPPMPFNVTVIKQREASRRHYAKHRERVIESAKKYSKIARDRIRAYITTHLKANPCVDCGETDAIVLEFDHVTSKDFNISDAARKGVSMKKLRDEIAKCEVRCSNCHRRKTYERSGLTHKD